MVDSAHPTLPGDSEMREQSNYLERLTPFILNSITIFSPLSKRNPIELQCNRPASAEVTLLRRCLLRNMISTQQGRGNAGPQELMWSNQTAPNAAPLIAFAVIIE